MVCVGPVGSLGLKGSEEKCRQRQSQGERAEAVLALKTRQGPRAGGTVALASCKLQGAALPQLEPPEEQTQAASRLQLGKPLWSSVLQDPKSATPCPFRPLHLRPLSWQRGGGGAALGGPQRHPRPTL